MKRNPVFEAALCLSAVVIAYAGGVAHAASADKFILGESVAVSGGTVTTWARVNGGGKVIWAGLTLPLSMVENPPAPGTGPANAVAVLNYPPVVQQTTYFNHAEIHFNKHGHPANPRYADVHRYEAPHFDIHLYAIPVAQVFAIPFVPPSPALAQVPAERLPNGWGQPEFSVPQMGRHSAPLSEFTATDTWQATVLAGFLPDASFMHFIEPVIFSSAARASRWRSPCPQFWEWPLSFRLNAWCNMTRKQTPTTSFTKVLNPSTNLDLF